MEQYIPKSVVLAEIERLITHECGYLMNKLIEALDTLETKDVDLDFEQELYKAFGQVKDFTFGMRIAKHFFELGLKVQKGELTMAQEVHQSQWKPSEEMLEALYRAIPENVMEISEDEMLLDKLYQGLKYGRVLSKN